MCIEDFIKTYLVNRYYVRHIFRFDEPESKVVNRIQDKNIRVFLNVCEELCGKGRNCH